MSLWRKLLRALTGGVTITYSSGSGQTGAGGDTPSIGAESVGDIAVFIVDQNGSSSTTPQGASGNNFTQLGSDYVHDSSGRTMSIWYKELEAGDLSGNLSNFGAAKRYALGVYQPSGAVSSVTWVENTTQETNGTPTQQTIDASGGGGADVMIGAQWGQNSCTGFAMSSSDFTGTPGAVSDHNGFGMYASAGGSGVTVDGNDEGNNNFLLSGYVDIT